MKTFLEVFSEILEAKHASDDFDPEYDDDAGMAKTNLRMILDAASELHDMIEDDEKLPGHVVEKLVLATNYIRDARDYMKHKD